MTGLTRWAWLALIALQVVWFGWLFPIGLFDPALEVLLITVPLLTPAWWIWKLDHRALVVGGMIALPYFCIAVSEAWTRPEVRALALVQVGLIAVYFAGLVPSRRSAE